MNIHTLSEAKNHNSVDSTKKIDENNPNRSEKENTGLQDGVDVDGMLPIPTIYLFANVEYNNEYNYLLVNSNISIPNNSSCYTLTSPSGTSKND